MTSFFSDMKHKFMQPDCPDNCLEETMTWVYTPCFERLSLQCPLVQVNKGRHGCLPKKEAWWADGWVQPMKGDENSAGGYEAAMAELCISAPGISKNCKQ